MFLMAAAQLEICPFHLFKYVNKQQVTKALFTWDPANQTFNNVTMSNT